MFQKGNIPKIRKEIKYEINDNGCHICTSHSTDGDGYPKITRNNKQSKISRYIYEQRYGTIPPNMCVCHRCDNRACINPEHLFLGTNVENTADKVSKGRQIKLSGEKSPNAKLTETQVLEIINSKGCCQAKLATKYGVSFQLISAIILGKKWKHIPREESQ